jgi:hypothetical protein
MIRTALKLTNRYPVEKDTRMPNYHEINDETGNLTDVIPFCCSSCYLEWCLDNDEEYPGEWDREGGDSNEYCAQCGVICSAGEDACECQHDNFIVNRFLEEDGLMCRHGNWIQLPANYLGK